MARGKSKGFLLQAAASAAFLLLFVGAMGLPAFFPSLQLLKDTPWDFSFFWPTWGSRLLSFLWLIPVGLGFLGWNRWLRGLFFSRVEKGAADFLGLALALALFSLFVFGLAVNHVLQGPLTALFFLAAVREGWEELKGFIFEGIWEGRALAGWWLLPLFLWAFEYFSPPLVWDAILDHFRYAREVSRLNQIPFHWVNHTGDMPKAAELVLAGFWNLGGEPFAKLALALPALLTGWLLALFLPDVKSKASWIFWTCPTFFALYAFGYAEGFLAFFELTALFSFWRAIQEPKQKVWFPVAAFFMGMAITVKYTAVLALVAMVVIGVYEKTVRPKTLRLNPAFFLAFALPAFPWLFKNTLAFGNPFYPLATSIFGAAIGYSPEMERGLLVDTGVPWGMGLGGILRNLWDSFFTSSNAVNAAWTPLFVMSLPWFGVVLKDKLGRFLGLFALLFFAGWMLVSSSFRHASAGALVLVLLAALAWEAALKNKESTGKVLWRSGLALSLWLCLATQFATTAPYASALGLEDPLLRLKRHYSYDTDTYQAYRYIEEHSEPRDKVMAFAVFQTYPLQRTAFVDFKWKKPIFLEWASHCQTAEQLAHKLHEEGVEYFLYQQWEAKAMSKMEKDFKLEGMPVLEYRRFFEYYVRPVAVFGNSMVCRIQPEPHHEPTVWQQVPGLEGL